MFWFSAYCDNPGSQSTRNKDIKVSKSSEPISSDNKIKVNNAGWTITALNSAKKVNTSNIKLNDKFSNKHNVDAIDYILEDVISEEPYNIIDPSFGKIKISSFRELKFNGKTFAYLLNAQRTKFEKDEKKYLPIGIVFIFSYLDKDGDGKFETFLGNPGEDLYIPEWIF